MEINTIKAFINSIIIFGLKNIKIGANNFLELYSGIDSESQLLENYWIIIITTGKITIIIIPIKNSIIIIKRNSIIVF